MSDIQRGRPWGWPGRRTGTASPALYPSTRPTVPQSGTSGGRHRFNVFRFRFLNIRATAPSGGKCEHATFFLKKRSPPQLSGDQTAALYHPWNHTPPSVGLHLISGKLDRGSTTLCFPASSRKSDRNAGLYRRCLCGSPMVVSMLVPFSCAQ